MKQALLISFCLTLIIFSSCKQEDPVIPNEEELITTVTYSLVHSTTMETVNLVFTDLDGDGGDEPVITSGTLEANSTYTGALTLLNEAEDPAEDITLEIEEEDEDHQFFFLSSIADLNVDYTDEDSNSMPVGLGSTLTTGAAGTGTLSITLIHMPTKSATGVADGDITNADGETDIEVTFPINVQ